MPKHVLVHRDPLERLIRDAWDIGSGRVTPDIRTHLEGDSDIVVVAVQAGILVPGPLAGPPPPPPARRFRGGTPVGGVYRAEGDARLRCELDAKVVFPTEAQAVSATRLITSTRMYHYLGPCGHWHLTRQRQDNRG